LGEAAEELEKINATYDQAKVTQVEAEAEVERAQVRAGLLSTTNLDAVGASEKAKVEFAKIRDRHLKSLTTDRQRRIFTEVFTAVEGQDYAAIATHEARQIAGAQKGAAAARAAVYKNRAVDLRDDPVASTAALETALIEISNRYSSEGPDEVAYQRAIAVTDVRKQVALLHADRSLELGEQYLETYKDEIFDVDAREVEHVIRTRRAQEAAEARRIAREKEQDDREAAAELGEQARDTIEMIDRGNIVDPESVAQLATRLEEVGKPVLAVSLRSAATVQTFKADAREWRPDQLQGWINQERTRTKGKATAEEAATIDAAETLLGEMRGKLKADPLSWAVEAGAAKMEPLDLDSGASIAKRVKTALSVADRFGTAPRFMTDEEQAHLSSSIGQADARGKVKIVGAIASGFGRHSRDVLNSLSNSDPVFAHAAGLSMVGGAQRVTAQRIFEGQEALKSKAVAIPSGEKFNAALAPYGRAMAFTPKTRGAVIESAKAIYASFALAGGYDPAYVDELRWGIALNRAAGATYNADNKRIGGFAHYRGQGIILPTNVSPDEFGTLMGRLTDKAVKAVGDAPRYANGKPVAAADIAKGYLFDAGSGRYFVSLDQAGSQFIQGKSGHYVLDMGALVPYLRGRR
jgi:hypothetical protein